MKKEEVELTVSQLKEELLGNNLTWYKKDDMGFGSIQEKYGASDLQIATIMKHPKLVGVEPNCKVFIVRDDTEDALSVNEKTILSQEDIIMHFTPKEEQELNRINDQIKKQQGEALIEL